MPEAAVELPRRGGGTLAQAVHAAFIGALNHLLRGEAWARARLAAHAGKTVGVELAPFALAVVVTDDGLVNAAVAPERIDVRLVLSAAALPQLAAAALAGGAQAAAMRQVRIEGDADLAHALSAVFQHLRWDVEDDLSRVVGNVAAHRLAGAASSVVGQLRDVQQRAAANLAEYLTEERPTLVARAQQAAFADEVTRLRAELERLEKRVARLDGPHPQ